MSDITKRLRQMADPVEARAAGKAYSEGDLWNGLEEAADEIDRLRAELEAERTESAEWERLAHKYQDERNQAEARVRELEEVLGVLRGKHGNATDLHIAMSGVIDRIDEALANSEKGD